MPQLNTKFQQFQNRLFNPAPDINAEPVARSQGLAQGLFAQGSSTQPIQHPFQGLARLGAAINSGIHRQRALRGEKALEGQGGTKGQEQGDFLAAIARGNQIRNDFAKASAVRQADFRHFIGRRQSKLGVGPRNA